MNAIKVVDYDPSWPALFAAERVNILSLLSDLIDKVHHIGSTSVPGLAAKPKIDIDAVLRSADMLPEGIRRTQTTGLYAYHGDPYDDGMWTFTQGRGSYGTRLYLCGPGNMKHEHRVLFRDWLRTHPQDAAAYEALKRRLAVEANGDWNFYTGGKSQFVTAIVEQARMHSVERART
jgi:GrpB-like predicted nucleotidyltransferase (UPF0157 family)